MSKGGKRTLGGPFVTQAVICERILRETDGVLTPVRIIDRITAHIVPISEDVAEQVQQIDKVQRRLSALITVKSGDVEGKRTLKLVCKSLSMDQSYPVVFEGGHKGMNLVLEMNLSLTAGVHWFSVMISGRLITKFPLQVVIQFGQVGTTGAESTTTVEG